MHDQAECAFCQRDIANTGNYLCMYCMIEGMRQSASDELDACDICGDGIQWLLRYEGVTYCYHCKVGLVQMEQYQTFLDYRENL